MTKSLRYVLISFCKDVVKIKSLLHIIPDLFLTYFCKHILLAQNILNMTLCDFVTNSDALETLLTGYSRQNVIPSFFSSPVSL